MTKWDVTPLLRNSFYKVWNKKCPHIKIRKPRTDVCEKCTELRAIGDLDGLEDHLVMAKDEREAFKQSILRTRERSETEMQISFDFAEKITIPRFVDQPKGEYYLTGLTMDFFGVANNTTGIQLNYVLAEGHWPQDKGATTVCSMLKHFIDNNASQKRRLRFMAGNCSGQNKNKYIMWFFAYLAMTMEGLGRIDLQFLIAGHTKNFCDASFGLVKKSLKNKNLLSPENVVRCATNSAKCNTVETAGAVGWYDWRAFLEQFFDGQVPHISKHHIFAFSRSKPGYVWCKELSTTPGMRMYSMLREGVTAEMVCNPQPPLKPLEEFRIDPQTYALMNQKGQPNVRGLEKRDDYLKFAVLDRYYLGELDETKKHFCLDGSLGKG